MTKPPAPAEQSILDRFGALLVNTDIRGRRLGLRRLVIGKGFVDNVTPAMRNYEVSGKIVLDQWFSYRRRDRTKPMIGDRRPPSLLEKIQPDGWLAEYTEDLLNLLNVLGRLVALEPRQADLLDRIVAGPLVALAPDKRKSGTMADEPSPSLAPSATLA